MTQSMKGFWLRIRLDKELSHLWWDTGGTRKIKKQLPGLTEEKLGEAVQN